MPCDSLACRLAAPNFSSLICVAHDEILGRGQGFVRYSAIKPGRVRTNGAGKFLIVECRTP